MVRAHIIWDFNGTLLDDLPAAMAAVTDMLRARGGPDMTAAWYYSLVEMPIIRFYQKIPLLAEVPFDILTQEFNDGYVRHQDRIGLAAGALKALSALDSAGVRQSILSSFEQSRIEGWLGRFGIASFFDAVLGADDLRSEGKIHRARSWAEAIGLDRVRTVLVGDTVHDWEAAEALGVRCVLVSYGHQRREDLAVCGVPILDDLSALPALLAEMGILERGGVY